MLWTIIVILVVLWLLGFIGHIGGGLDPSSARHCESRANHNLNSGGRGVSALNFVQTPSHHSTVAEIRFDFDVI